MRVSERRDHRLLRPASGRLRHRLPHGRKDRIVAEPVVIAEVLPDSTARRDKVFRNRAHRSLDSETQCVIVDQLFALVDRYPRTSEGWLHEGHSRPDDVLPLPRLTLGLTLAEICEDTEMPAPPAD